MSLFTPVTGIIGGSLIGLSASSLLVLNGDILGFSGLISSTFLNLNETFHNTQSHWKLVWMSTFMLTVNFYINHVQDANRDPRLETSGEVPIASAAAHVLGGFLVGLGTKLANGCTSGHGVCGLARKSKRSFVAVPIFVSASMLTSMALNYHREDHSSTWSSITSFLRTDTLPLYSKAVGTATTAVVVALGLLRQPSTPSTSGSKKHPRKVIGAAVSAVLAAMGLIVSGMTKKSKVADFLDLCALCRGKSLDPTLATVMGSAMLASWWGYQFVPGYSTLFRQRTMSQPLLGDDEYRIPSSTTVDLSLVGGSALFGVGWGLTGLCPGPALYHAASGMTYVTFFWFPSFFAASWLGGHVKEYLQGMSFRKGTSSEVDKPKSQ